jgi:ketose-bisphosphate aldolase
MSMEECSCAENWRFSVRTITMLSTLKPVLLEARANGCAIPAFDCVEDIMIRTVLETCESLGCPAIVMGLVGPDLDGHGWHYIPGLVRAVADTHKIPVVLHLDHATELDQIRRAVDLGFTSVMIDGSSLPLAENIRLTKAAVQIAHAADASVEGELGHVGGADIEETQHAESVLTEPKEVERFVAETGVDALAVSIGTSHGVYRALPDLNIGRLSEIRACTDVPLVLHGGSGTPDDQIKESVRHGITKLNIYADLRAAMLRGLQISARTQRRQDPLPRDLFDPIRDKLGEVVEQKIRLLFSRRNGG